MSTTFRLGHEAKLYYGPADALESALIEAGNVRDATVQVETSMADTTTRANGGWEGNEAATRACTIEFDLLARPGSPDYQAFMAAGTSGDKVRLLALTGARGEPNVDGPFGNFAISSYSRSEPVRDEVITISITARSDGPVVWRGAS